VSETGLDGVLDVDTWLDGGRSVVELAGELDVYSVSRLRDAVAQLPREGKHRIAVEMSRLDFIDSSSLGVLVGATKQARALGGGVCLVGAQERILKMFRITGLVRIIPAFTGLDEAFAWLDSLHA
jgi:anti-sigma B factor antagonist